MTVLYAMAGPLPDQIVLPPWAQWILLVAAIIAAVRAIWTKVVQPLSRTLVLAENTLPVLQEIETHFRPNGGSSLYDVVTDTRRQVAEMRAHIDGLQDRQTKLYEQVNPPPDRDEALETLIVEAVERAARKARRGQVTPPPPPPTNGA